MPSVFGVVTVPSTKQGTFVRFDMRDYVMQSVEHYCTVTKTDIKSLKKVNTPYCPEGSLHPDHDEEQGEVSGGACSILMKNLWAARLSRPDFIRPTCRLAGKVQK